MELLQKLYEEDCEVAEERDVNSHVHEWMDRLSLDQKKEFDSWIKSESWSAIVPEFVPWWQESHLCIESDFARHVPAIHFPGQQALQGSQRAHPDLVYSLADLLFSYVVVCYHTLGEHRECLEFIPLMTSLSYYLELEQASARNVFVYHSMDEVLDIAFSRLRMTGLMLEKQPKESIRIRKEQHIEKSEWILLQSIVQLLEPDFLLRAVSDIHHCFQTVESTIPPSIKRRVLRKIEFLLALGQTLSEAQLQWLQTEIKVYAKRFDQQDPKETYTPLIQVIEE
jgi:hypothetical protein